MNLKLQQDSRNKWNIINIDNNRVVTGHITTRKLALNIMKNYKEPTKSLSKASNSMSRKDQIRHARAKKQGISYADYIAKYVVGG